MQQIVALARRGRTRREQLCLATVVHVEGSAYRKPGARMLLTSSGERTGSISGGCLEAEVSRKAWWLTANGPRVERYSSFADEDGGMPYGLGCGGIISLLLEQGEGALATLAALEWALTERQPSVMVMAIGGPAGDAPSVEEVPGAVAEMRGHQPIGTLAILTRAGRGDPGPQRLPAGSSNCASAGSLEVVYRQNGLALEQRNVLQHNRQQRSGDATTHNIAWEKLTRAAQAAFQQRQSCFLDETFSPCAATMTGAGESACRPAYFVQYLAPPPALTIFGAGDDAQPIAGLAHALGWRVTVADGRAHLARRDRFPLAAEVRVLDYADPSLQAACGIASPGRHVEPPATWRPAEPRVLAGEDSVSDLCADEIAVILTHSYEQDRALLAALLPLNLRYLGILGPRHRTERLLGEVAPALGITVAQGFTRLHSPIGLDLGASEPASVALSIIAEIQAVLHERQVEVTRTNLTAANGARIEDESRELVIVDSIEEKSAKGGFEPLAAQFG